MAAFESLRDMYDVALNPRILRTLMKEDVPDEKKPFDTTSKLSTVVATIQTRKLLSECFLDTMDQKLVGRWKSAVDDWLNRLLSLVSIANMPDKCWAGICLLGVTSQECSSERFVASYTVWFEKLLSFMQPSVESQFLKVASCASMSDLITRLAGFPKLKKDGTSCAGKLIQPLLSMLNEDSPETVQERALHLLCTVITSFPASLGRNYDSVEAAIASRMLSGNGGLSVQKKLAYSLALLPKSRGDEDIWRLLIQRILLLLNGCLTDTFYGLEEESKWGDALKLLVPPGEAPPQVIWGHKLVEQVSGKERRRSKLSAATLLMFSCSMMLTNSYPIQVNVPVQSLLAVVDRVLMVHGSLPEAMSSFVIAAEQEYLCSELPLLHSCSLEILSSVIKAMRSQLLPHAMHIVRLIEKYFKRCQLPYLRQKVYVITKMLLVSMGAGIAIKLAQEVVNNSLIDLKPVADHTMVGSSNVSSEAWMQPGPRKRKLNATETLEQRQNSATLELPSTEYTSATVSVKVAALEAIEALLTVGGALRSESWRSSIDDLLIRTVKKCCKGRWGNDERSFFSNEPTSLHSDLQLAALRALLASLLSPSRTRPPHLAESLELFRQGRQETGTRVSDFCAHALLALEVLIHPRALPLIDSLSMDPHHGFDKPSTRFPSAENGGNSEPNEDMLFQSWIKNYSKENEDSAEMVKRQRTNMEEEIEEEEEETALEPAGIQSQDETNVDAAAGNNAEADTRIGNNEITQHNEFDSAAVTRGEFDDNDIVMGDKSEELQLGKDASLVPPESDKVSTDSIADIVPADPKSTGAESDNESTDTIPDIVLDDPDSD